MAPTGYKSESITLRQIARLVWRCWPYYRPMTKHLMTYLALNAIMGAIILGGTFVVNDIVNNKILIGERLQPLQAAVLFVGDEYVTSGAADEVLLSDGQRKVVRTGLIAWVGVFVILLMGSFSGVGYYMAWIYQRINQALRVTMLERAESLSLRYHSRARTGDAIYRVYQDSATITNVLQNLIITPLRVVCWLGFSVLVLSFFSPWLGLLAFATVLPITGLIVFLTPKIRAFSMLARETNSNLTSRIQEVFAAIRIIKANAAEARMFESFERDSKRALDAAFYLRVYIALLSTGVIIVAISAVLIAEYLMAGWSIDGTATYLGGVVALVGFATWNLGAFQQAVGTSGEAAEQSRQFANLWAVAQDLIIGLRRAFYLLELEPEVADPIDAKPFPEVVRRVAWRGVEFGYEAGRSVLAGVDLDARAGTITAIVGATGSGKSTLMSLLLRLYDTDAGSVLINDTDVASLRLDDLRRHVAVALQRNVLFATTIAENIAYATVGASREAIEDAARIACADHFVRAMPKGYDTELGERGGKLSTGQRQRLSIARAVLRDTPILILDEPTASLDAETEQQVLGNLTKWGRDRVILLITHRLSTIRSADQIAFLEDGRIKECGTHDELMAKAGGYRNFVLAELQGADGSVYEPGRRESNPARIDGAG